MPYAIELLENLPASTVVATLIDPFDGSAEPVKMVNELNATVAGLEGDAIFVIADLTQINLHLGVIVQGLAAAFSRHQSVTTDHLDAGRVRTLMIGTGALMKMAVKATRQDQYGNRQIELFSTLDETLDYIRQTAKA